MATEIKKGWVVDEATERIITDKFELSKDLKKGSVMLIFKTIGGVSVPHMAISLPTGVSSVDLELKPKIPPTTGELK